MLIRKIGIVSRTYRHVNRYRQILTVLFKYGFGDLVSHLPLGQVLEAGLHLFSGRRRPGLENLSRAERVRMAVEELGPTFVKLAQVLSTRPDLIPPRYLRELEKLQDHVPPFPFSEVQKIVEKELGAPLAEKFAEFEEAPLAAASIGQVHRARLPGGQEVAVKVRRPGVRERVEADLEILYHLAGLAEKHLADWSFHRPTRIVEEFARTLEKELDYGIEASHAERFARQFRDTPSVFVPRVYREASTTRLLTLEFVRGIKISEVDLLREGGHDLKLIASRGADLILQQVFHHGFFHADPHPGNLFILPDNVICYLDYGMMGVVDRQGREDFAELVYGYLRQDESRVAQALLKIVEGDFSLDRRALERDLAEFLGDHLQKPLGELRIALLLRDLLGLIQRHRLRLPPDMLLMIKAMATAEAVGCQLDPGFEMARSAAPFILRIRMERMDPRRVLGQFIESGGDFLQLLKEIPRDLSGILQQVREGKVKIRFEHRGLENLIFHLDRSSNRIAFSLIIAALIVGSSMILQTHMGPELFGFPFLGLLGFTVAGVLGLGLLISILRSGRL